MTSCDDVMRTIIDLPDDQLNGLAILCRRDGISRAEAIPRAVADYTRAQLRHDGDEGFGLWRSRREDGVRYQRRLRKEW